MASSVNHAGEPCDDPPWTNVGTLFPQVQVSIQPLCFSFQAENMLISVRLLVVDRHILYCWMVFLVTSQSDGTFHKSVGLISHVQLEKEHTQSQRWPIKTESVVASPHITSTGNVSIQEKTTCGPKHIWDPMCGLGTNCNPTCGLGRQPVRGKELRDVLAPVLQKFKCGHFSQFWFEQSLI